jgi:hypothetical protein
MISTTHLWLKLVMAITFAMVQGQPTIPSSTQDYEVGNMIFPGPAFMQATVTQCEPFLSKCTWITKMATIKPTPDNLKTFLNLSFPFSNIDSYLAWVCNIPAGDSFIFSAIDLYFIWFNLGLLGQSDHDLPLCIL